MRKGIKRLLSASFYLAFEAFIVLYFVTKNMLGKRETAINIFQKFTAHTVVIKDRNINHISAFSNVVIVPAIQLPVLLKRGFFSCRNEDKYQ